MSSLHGTFAWYELMTSDAPAAEAFYRNLIGWGAEDVSQGETPYTAFTVDGVGVAGLLTTPPEAAAMGARPCWMGYVNVDDVDLYAGKVVQAGGTVHRAASDIPNVGRFAVVADPQGASFVLFKAAEGMNRPPVKGPEGLVGWHELMAAEGVAAFDFYSSLFGWTKDRAYDMGPMGTYQLFATGGEAIGGIMTKPDAIPTPYWGYYIHVDSIKAAISRLQACGGTVINGPHQVPSDNWIVQGLDPQGALFCLVSPHA